MKKFLVLFLIPIELLENWMKTDANERKIAEEKMKVAWDIWMQANAESFIDTPAGAGKTKVVTQNGVADTKNNIMMYGTIKANSQEEAASLFIGHPHLEIPEATIEITKINPLKDLANNAGIVA